MTEVGITRQRIRFAFSVITNLNGCVMYETSCNVPKIADKLAVVRTFKKTFFKRRTQITELAVNDSIISF